jgi:cytochrome o ubiquinol oxidase subunit IV
MNRTSHHHPAHDTIHAASHGSLKSYVIGIVLSLLLTLASFGAVMTHVVPRGFGLATIVVLCVAQLVVQLIYFLHIGAARDQRANTGIFVCTVSPQRSARSTYASLCVGNRGSAKLNAEFWSKILDQICRHYPRTTR